MAKPWLPEPLTFECFPESRSPENLRLAAEQFRVESNPRYLRNQRGVGETYCNILTWDVTRAMHCEVPHKYLDRELSARDTIAWLASVGLHERGWAVVGEAEALARASKGHPVIATWINTMVDSTGKPLPSHVAVLLPPTKEGKARIVQAGRNNLWDVPLTRGFGYVSPTFYAHL